jgi:hypothetical protein
MEDAMASNYTKRVALSTTMLRVANARGLHHRKGYSAAIRACDAADWREGKLLLQHPTLEQASAIFAVSLPSIMRAQALSPAQREEVRSGWRPLAPMPPVLPPTLPMPLPAVVPADKPVAPTTMNSVARFIEAQFIKYLDVLGIDRALVLMAERDAQRVAQRDVQRVAA